MENKYNLPNYVSMTEMLKKAQEGHYAVGQFNINNLEWVSAILDTCQELKAPVILGVSKGAATYMGGHHVVVDMVLAYMHDNNITIPVAIHVDHGPSFEWCKAAIDAGYSSVMIDGSKLPLEENIALVKKVVDYAHPRRKPTSIASLRPSARSMARIMANRSSASTRWRKSTTS